jgi:zeaxanthin glucosyltransferase
MPEISRMQGDEALQFAAQVMSGQSESILKSLPDVVNANGIDVLLIDTVQFYVEFAAIQLGMPYLHVAGAVHFDYSGYTPMCLYGRRHQTTPEAFARNREDVGTFVNILNSANAGIKAYAEKAGLEVDWGRSRFHSLAVSVN